MTEFITKHPMALYLSGTAGFLVSASTTALTGLVIPGLFLAFAFGIFNVIVLVTNFNHYHEKWQHEDSP